MKKALGVINRTNKIFAECSQYFRFVALFLRNISKFGIADSFSNIYWNSCYGFVLFNGKINFMRDSRVTLFFMEWIHTEPYSYVNVGCRENRHFKLWYSFNFQVIEFSALI